MIMILCTCYKFWGKMVSLSSYEHYITNIQLTSSLVESSDEEVHIHVPKRVTIYLAFCQLQVNLFIVYIIIFITIS